MNETACIHRRTINELYTVKYLRVYEELQQRKKHTYLYGIIIY